MKKRLRNGSSEILTFAVISVLIVSLILAITEIIQIISYRHELVQAVTAVSRIAAVSSDMKDAKENAEEIMKYAFDKSSITNTQANIEYATSKKRWEPGNQLVVSVSGDTTVFHYFKSKNKKVTTVVTIEGMGGDGGGNAVNVPSSLRQTGIISDFTNYTYFYPKWSLGTTQRKLSRIWNDKGRQSVDHVATIDGYYLVATTKIFGKCGDRIKVYLENGESFMAMIADEKGPGTNGNPYGHPKTGGVSIIEWEAKGTAASSTSGVQTPLGKASWQKKKVVKIINMGKYPGL